MGWLLVSNLLGLLMMSYKIRLLLCFVWLPTTCLFPSVGKDAELEIQKEDVVHDKTIWRSLEAIYQNAGYEVADVSGELLKKDLYKVAGIYYAMYQEDPPDADQYPGYGPSVDDYWRYNHQLLRDRIFISDRKFFDLSGLKLTSLDGLLNLLEAHKPDYLDLSNNLLKKIPGNLFPLLQALTHLNLSYNKLQLSDKLAFTNPSGQLLNIFGERSK